MELAYLAGDVLLLASLCYAGYIIYNDCQPQSTVLQVQYQLQFSLTVVFIGFGKTPTALCPGQVY